MNTIARFTVALLIHTPVPLLGQAHSPSPCDTAQTTQAMVQCQQPQRLAAESLMARYLRDARALTPHRARLDSTQAVWEAYRRQQVDAVMAEYDGGSLGQVDGLATWIYLTSDRARELWITYLSHEDSIPKPPGQP